MKPTANLCLVVAIIFSGFGAMPAMARQIMIGPANPGAEDGSDGWWVGASGKSYLLVDHTDPASGISDFSLGNTNLDGDHSAGWRSVIFPLGPAAAGAKPITFSFTYKLIDEVKPGDNILVQLRFFDQATNWISERDFPLGDSSHDSAMSRYKTVSVGDIRAPRRAQVADVHVNINFQGYHWSSGTGRFDDFSVKVTTHSLLLEVIVLAVVLLGITITAAFLLHSRRKNKMQPNS
jgi:hypothetical protein